MVRNSLQILKVAPDVMQQCRRIDTLLIQPTAILQIMDPGEARHIQEVFRRMAAKRPFLFQLLNLPVCFLIQAVIPDQVYPFHA